VLDVVLNRARAEVNLRRVICDLSNVPYVDIAGARMLCRLHEELTTTGVDFTVVEAHGPVREILRADGLQERVGSITRHASLADLVAEPSASSPTLTANTSGSGDPPEA